MTFDPLMIATIIGIIIGITIREAILVTIHGWSYKEKLKTYNKQRLHKEK